MKTSRIGSGTKWESEVGYSRAVRVGPLVEVSGTTATDEDGRIVGDGDPYRQTVRAFQNVGAALSEAGAGFEDVILTRIYLTDVRQWPEIGRAHRKFFGDVRPPTST